jgi:hypothetical protein
MAEYDITAPNGETYTITAPEGATEEQVLAYAQSQLSANTPSTQEQPTNTSLANRFKNALASDFGLGKALVNFAVPESTQQGPQSIYDRLLRPSLGTRAKSALSGMESGTRSALDVLGGSPLPQETDVLGQVKETALQTAVDPLSYVGLGVGPKQLAKAGLANLAAAPAIVGGGIAGQKIEEMSTGKDTGLGRVVGSLFGAGGSVAYQGTVSNAATAGAKTVKQAYKGWKNKEEAVKQWSSPAVKGFLEETSKAGGYGDINKVVDDFSKIHKDIVGVDAPVLTALSENPVVQSTLKSLVQADKTFKARVDQEINTVKEAINKKATDTFGPSVLDFAPTDKVISPKALNNAASIQERISMIDNKIDGLSNRFDTGLTSEQIGTSIENLIKAKEKIIKETVTKPMYEKVIKDAEAGKVKMPAEGTRLIYDYVKANNLQDLFTRGSRIETDINKYFRPKNGAYPEASFNNVVSLKENINQLKRDFANSPNELRRINELSKKIEEARTLIPGDFNQRLKEADLTYYQKLGVPFNEQGIIDIDSRKYAEQVAPVITKTPSALTDFLEVTGEEGKVLARNAILSDFYNGAKGDVNPKTVANYLFKKKNVISQVDGLENEFKQAMLDAESLYATRKALDEKSLVKEKELADNFLLSSGQFGPNYSQTASRMLTDRRYLEKVKKDISNLAPEYRDAVDNTLKRATVDNILSHPNGALDFMTKPDNQKTVSLILGKDYVEGVKNLSKLSDAIARLDTSKVNLTPSKSESDLIGRYIQGLDTPFVTSTLRDRISSVVQKGVRLASRISDAKIRQRTTEDLESILLDKDGITTFNQNVKSLNLENPVDLRKAAEAYARLIPSRTIIGTKQGVQGASQEQEPPVQVPIGQFQ